MKRKMIIMASLALGLALSNPVQAQVYTEDFNSYVGTSGGAQGGTGFPVFHTGNTDVGWSTSGWAWGGVQLDCIGGSIKDFAVMLGQDGVATSPGIAANNCGTSYEVEFDYGPTNWTTCCTTVAGDGVFVEVLNQDDIVLASDTYLPGAWAGSNLGFTGTLAYNGDGVGPARVRFTAVNGSADWTLSVSIDNVTVSETGSFEAFCPQPLDGNYNSTDNITELTFNVPAPIVEPSVTCTVVYGTDGTESSPGILSDVSGNSTAVSTGSVAYAPAVGDHFWQIKVEELGQATYHSPVYAFTIEEIIYGAISHDTVFFASDFNGYVGTSSGNAQADTALEVAHSGEHAGWVSGGTAHAVNLDPNAGDWAYMTLNAFTLTQSAGVAANDLGVNYKINFDYGTAVYSVASQATTADNGLLVEVLRGDNTVLASDTFMPGAWAPGNYNLDAGLKGTLTYVGDYTGDVRIRLSKAGPGIFGASVDNVSLTPNWFNPMPTDGDHHAGENITELTHFVPDPIGAGPVTCTVVYGTDGTEAGGILSDAGGNSTAASTGSVAYVPGDGDHFWQIKVEEPGQATYYSPIYAFSIVNAPPVAIIGGPVADGTAYHSWTEQGVEQNIFIWDGGSYDPDAEPGDVLTYEWSTTASADGFNFADPTVKDPTIGISDSCGTWDLTLTVTDADGATGTSTAVNGIHFQCEPCNYAIWGHPQDYMWEGENLNPRYRDHQAADVYDARGIYPANEVYLRNDCRVDIYDLQTLAAVWLGDRTYVDGATPYFDLKWDADVFCGNPQIGVDIDPNTGMFDFSVLSDQWGTDMLLTPPDYSKP